MPVRQLSMLSRCGTGSALAASAWMPRTNPGGVTSKLHRFRIVTIAAAEGMCAFY
jgi:hypothetical protein